MRTVELLEDKKPWNLDKHIIPRNKIMHLKVDYGEVQIGRLIKSCCGHWNKEKVYRELTYRDVVALGLENRVINDLTLEQ